MGQFEYLSVLTSIIIGLAITQLLSGAARLIQIRHRVRMHATTLCWMAMLFLVDTQIWWVAFERREAQHWNFFAFLFYLLIPITAFLLSYLVLPELGDEDDVSLVANFERNRPWFFGLFVLLLSVSILEEWSRMGRMRADSDLVFRVAFLLFSLSGALVRNARFHFWSAVVVLALFCTYIGSQFLQLH